MALIYSKRMDENLTRLQSAGDFRPIGLPPGLLMETVIDRFIRDGPLIRSPLHASQHAYVSGKSTDYAWHQPITQIEGSLDVK